MLIIVKSNKLWEFNHLFMDFWINFHVFVINMINYLDLDKHENVLFKAIVVEF